MRTSPKKSTRYKYNGVIRKSSGDFFNFRRKEYVRLVIWKQS